MTDTTQPDALQVEEPEIVKTMRKNLDGWDNRAVCVYIDALLAANRELAKEVGRIKGLALKDPVVRLHNLCEALEECKSDSPYSAESWEQADADNKQLRQRAEQAETRALAAQKDAGRYRILWEQNEREHTTRDAECVINWNHGHDWAPVKDLDAAVAAIDAAAK